MVRRGEDRLEERLEGCRRWRERWRGTTGAEGDNEI